MKLINVSNCNPEYYENPTASWVKVWIAVILVVAGIFNYFLLARKRQHNKIVEEFKSESKEKRKKGMMYLVKTASCSRSKIESSDSRKHAAF